MSKRITDKQVNEMCEKVDAIRGTLREAMRMALALASEGDARALQIRGAFSGTKEAAVDADGFLSGLRMCLCDGGAEY